MSKLTKAKGPIMGVLGGIAKSMNINPLILRIGVPAICLIPGVIFFVVVAYLVLGVALPKEQPARLEGGDYADPDKLGSADVRFCSVCGTKNSTEAKYCRSCGGEVNPV